MYRYQRDTCGTSASPSATSPPRSKWLGKKGTFADIDTCSDAEVTGRHEGHIRKGHVAVVTDDDSHDTPPDADERHHNVRLDDLRRPATVMSPSKRGQGRGGRNQITALKSDLPAADPGAVTIHRWRKRRERKWNSGMTLAQQAMVRSQAEQIRAYIKAIRKGGGLLREMAEAGERQTGGNPKLQRSRGATVAAPSLTDMGFTKSRASPSVAGNVVRFPANVLIESGVSQRQAAKMLNVSNATISRDVRGTNVTKGVTNVTGGKVAKTGSAATKARRTAVLT